MTASAAVGSLEAGLAGDGSLRWAAADLTQVLESTRRRLDLSPVAAAALGRSLTGAALLLRLASKTPSRLVIEIRGDGPLVSVLAEADDGGNLRGMVGRPRAEVPHTAAGKLAVGRAVGQGTLRVVRQHERGAHQSRVELVTGEIGDDLAHYLAQSDQTRSAVLLGVLADPSGIAAAGGMIVEAMPEAPAELVRGLERRVERMATVSRVLAGGGVRGLVERLVGGLGPRTVERRELRYRCRCSRRTLARHLRRLDREQLGALETERGDLEAECAFCGSVYRFGPAELTCPSH